MKFRYRNLKIPKGGEQGFVIVEALIGAAIFGIFMVAVVYMMVGSVRANTRALKISEATALAADRVERISQLPMTDNRLVNNTFLDEPVVVGGHKFTIIITTQNNVPKARAISVQVEVRWNDQTSARVVGGTGVRSVVIRDVLTG